MKLVYSYAWSNDMFDMAIRFISACSSISLWIWRWRQGLTGICNLIKYTIKNDVENKQRSFFIKIGKVYDILMLESNHFSSFPCYFFILWKQQNFCVI